MPRSATAAVPGALLVAALAWSVGCGEDGTAPAPASPAACSPPNRVVGDRCLEPGVADDGCPAGTLGIGDGACRPAGIGPEMCGAGFAHDGDVGCNAILPADPCPKGKIAVPGDIECRPVMPCGAGEWGDIPVEASTQYVDQSYAGTDSDGSEAKPWTTIGDAFAAAASGELIAVAAGSYGEDVIMSGKSVRIWGVCPEDVEIVGTGAELTALFFGNSMDGSEVHGLAIRGPKAGIQSSGSEGVTVDRVWVHDTGARGIQIQNNFGTTAMTVRGSLVEAAREAGIFLGGVTATIEASSVRDTQPHALVQKFGRGVSVEPVCEPVCDPDSRSTVKLTGSLLERNHEVGLFVEGSDAVMQTTVVRDTLPDASDDTLGRGVHVQLTCEDDGCDPNMRGKLDLKTSVIERSHDLGLLVFGADATVEATVVRDTAPRASDQLNGWGIAVQPPCTEVYCHPEVRATATVRSSLVERGHDYGIVVGASDALVEATVVRDTAPRAFDDSRGRGVSLQLFCSGASTVCNPDFRTVATVRGSVVEDSYEAGLLVAGSDATIESTLIRSTAPRAWDGLFGDGLAVVFSYGAPATAIVTGSVVAESARAGLASFGGDVSLHGNAIQCAAFELEGDPYEGRNFTFEDGGANGCGCPAPDGHCLAVSTGLAPPTNAVSVR